MATDFLFTGTPAVTDASDAAPGLSLGTRIEVVNSGFFIGIRWRFPDTLPASTVQWRVDGYDPVTDASTGTLRSGTFTAPVAGTYVTETFADLAVSTGDEFVAYIWTPDRYVGTINFFTLNVNSVSGNYLGPADDTGVPARRNGRFAVGASITYPTSGVNRFGYFVDVVWSDTESTATGELDAVLPGLTGDIDAEATASGDVDAVLPLLEADLAGEAVASSDMDAVLPGILGDIVGLVPGQGILNAVLPGLNADLTGASAAGGATVGPCSWPIPDPTCCADDWALIPPQIQSEARDYAALILWAATGRQFGLCEVTVRPCGMKRCQDGGAEFWGYDWSGGTWVPYIFNGTWFNCGCPGMCCCDPRCQVRLMGPVDSIVEVLIGGIAVDPNTYFVNDEHWLVRTHPDCWPRCADQNALVSDDTFEVTYMRGTPVPNALLRAAATLACEWAKACVGNDSCRLGNRVTSAIRQGITINMVSPEELLESGLTGLWEVDTVIRAFNPYRNVQRVRVYAPELNVPKTVTWP